MKKTHLLKMTLAALALTQLTACAHRSYVSETAYGQSYPNQYNNDGYYTSQRSSRNDRQYDDRNQNQYQQTEVAQIVNMRNVSTNNSSRSSNENSGGGAVVGAIIGGIIGNQLGRGDDHHVNNRRTNRYDSRYDRRYSNNSNSGDRAAATIGGALIGGIIGSAVENSNNDDRNDRNNRNNYRQNGTEISLRLQNGQIHNLLVDNPGHLRIGDRVRVGFQQGRIVIL
jgi:outer membrane lipoprotein SlyB